ncbi:MAG: DUF4129 domain-containing protein [Chloroflexota bacterium]|nr:DUF4129 domain-containing protein [Chloroflexota bacterium]
MIWAQLGMELCLGSLALGLAWIGFAGGGWPPPPLAVAPAAVGLASARLFPDAWRRRWWYDWLRWTVALGWAAGCAIYAQGWSGASPIAGWNVAFIAGLLFFWRGWSLGDDGVDPRDVPGTVQVALVAALALVAVVQSIAWGAGLLLGVGTLLFGLLALGLARRAERRRPGAPAESDWLTLVGVLGLAILVVGGLLLLLVTPDGLAALWEQARVLGTLALMPFVALFGWLASLFDAGAATPPPSGLGQAPAPSPVPPPATPTGTPEWASALMTILTTVLPLLFLAAVLFFVGMPLLRRLSGLQPRRGTPATVEREPGPPLSVVERFSWRAWWQALLTRLFGVLRGAPERAAERHRAAAAAAARASAEAAGGPEPRTVRELYKSLLAAAAGQGLGRSSSTTPNELKRRLATARPDARRPLDVLTEIYIRTRYGEERPARDEVAEMRTAVREAVEAIKRPPEDGSSRLSNRIESSQPSPHPRSPWREE